MPTSFYEYFKPYKHCDEDFIKSLNNGQGMAYSFNSENGLAHVKYIYGVSKYKIIAINLKLIFLWLGRKAKVGD